MIGRIVEVSGTGRYLNAFRGFMEVRQKQELVGRVPLDEIAALIVNAYGATYSNQLLVTLTKRGIPIVVCGNNHAPQAVVFPCETHHQQGARLDAQLSVSITKKKRIWQQLVKAKLEGQAAVLQYFELPHAPVSSLIRKVKSGDTGNLEGVGARRYWPLLLGSEFRRDRAKDGINSCLNYGYTVLRATVARKLVATGLNPGIGLSHTNDGNPMRLVDDLIEPFRPFVDAIVKSLAHDELDDLAPPIKKRLCSLIVAPVCYENSNSLLTNAIENMCTSLVNVYQGRSRNLHLPAMTASSIAYAMGV